MIERPDELVAAAYDLLLNRDPDPAGLRYWSSALESGLPRTEFVRAMLASTEFRSRTDVAEAFTRYNDVDVVIPVGDCRFTLPASDTSLVPYLLQHRCWEPHILAWLKRTLQPSHVLVDAGANVGYFTVMCAPLVARVVAFEPAPVSYRYCRRNVELNGLTNAEVHALGLWHEDAALPMQSDAYSLMTAAVTPTAAACTGVAIHVVSLDSLIDRGLDLPRLDVLKMDIEGAELSALRGMQRTIARFRPSIVMEVNRPALATCGATIDEVWDFFVAHGYEIRAFEEWQPHDPDPVASLGDLKARCPDQALIDILAAPGDR